MITTGDRLGAPEWIGGRDEEEESIAERESEEVLNFTKGDNEHVTIPYIPEDAS